MPSQTSAEQGLPSSAQDVPLGERASAGQAPLDPAQVSDGSHTPVEDRQTVPPFSNWHEDEQQSPFVWFPSSHCSPVSTTPFPHPPL